MTSYIRNRKYEVDENVIKEYNVGVPQASSADPFLWLPITNELLNVLKEMEDVIVIDDLLALLKATASYYFTKRANGVLKYLVSWANKYSLIFS